MCVYIYIHTHTVLMAYRGYIKAYYVSVHCKNAYLINQFIHLFSGCPAKEETVDPLIHLVTVTKHCQKWVSGNTAEALSFLLCFGYHHLPVSQYYTVCCYCTSTPWITILCWKNCCCKF